MSHTRKDSQPPAAAGGAAGEAVDVREIEAQIHALQERLDTMLSSRHRPGGDAPPPSVRAQVELAAREVVERLTPGPLLDRESQAATVDTVRSLLSSNYYLRRWGRLGMRNRSEEVDGFGLDPIYEQRLLPLLDFLYQHYFRVSVEGIENIPAQGPALIVANHSGALPFDGVMLRTLVRREHPTGRDLRWLAEDYIYYLPFVGAIMSRIGAVRACPENAERLLAGDGLVAVFPEGVKGIGKLYKHRYKLQRFGRGGFIRLALRTRTPIIPCAVLGAEEASPMLYRDELLAKAFGVPYLPVTPTFPLLGPAGLVPAPTKWRISFGEMLRFDEYGEQSADDPVIVGGLAEQVREAIQQRIERLLRERKSVWRG